MPPTMRRKSRPRGPVWCAVGIALLGASTAHAFKVTTWNLWQYPGSALSTRQPLFRTVMQNLDTDVLIVQELATPAGADSFLINVLRNTNSSRVWKNAGFLLSTESTLYYDSLTVSGIANLAGLVTGGPRDVYQAVITPRGYTNSQARLRIYSVHFKAGNTLADSATRRTECTNLRNTLNVQSPAIPNLLLGGDTNFYGDWEGGYLRLLEDQADDDGRLRDSATLPGTWNQFAYRFFHSQAPCASGCLAGQSGGGLDDRFDFFLHSYAMADGQKVEFVSQAPYGNDGQHFNESVNQDGRNDAVPLAVADALKLAADHLPVVATLQLPAKIGVVTALDLGAAIVGGAASQNLTVENVGTLLPVDALTYSMTPPAGFTAPAGSFEALTGSPGNVHPIGMSTATAGPKAGTLAIASDDVDLPTANVSLTGTVLDHAVASLDSSALVPIDTLYLGARELGGFRDSSVRVHNAGYDALQARLSLDGGSIVGGSGRFSIVGGFSGGLVAGVGRTYNIHFDDDGATLDQTYEALLTFESSDEPLPGAATQNDLVVLLRARPVTTTGVGDHLPAAVEFFPARPNPITRETTLHFELPSVAPVRIEVFDLTGRLMATVADRTFEAGRHDVRWDAAGGRTPPGLYFARFTTPGHHAVQRIIVLP